LIVIARLVASSVTVFFWPAIVQVPDASETLTSGAPQSARRSGDWPNTALPQVSSSTIKRALRMMDGNFIGVFLFAIRG